MTEFVQHDDEEQPEILGDIPCGRGIVAAASVDFIDRHEEPRPMKKQVDACEAEQANRALARRGHVGSVLEKCLVSG